MHPLNKIRLSAGIVIDPLLEKSKKSDDITDCKGKGNKSKTYTHGVGVPPKDYPGMASGDGSNVTEADAAGGTTEELPNVGNVKPNPNPSIQTSTTSDQYKDGDVIIYDNGLHVVVLSDAKTDMVGIIPAGLANASAAEKNRAVEMVKPDPQKFRKLTKEELAVASMGEQQRAAIDDDMAKEFSMESVKDYDAPIGREDEMEEEKKHKKELSKSDAEEYKKKKKVSEGALGSKGRKLPTRTKQLLGAMRKKTGAEIPKGSSLEKAIKTESTMNYAGNKVSHEKTTSDPINVVGQGEKQWANSLDPKKVKNEYTLQPENRGKESMTDEVQKVKVPSKIKSDLKKAIAQFRKDGEAQGRINSHTASENAQLMLDTAEAFDKILDLLSAGDVMSLKRAQVFASSLMGPMLHKLPDGVWDFIVNGGEKRSLKNYMNKV